MDPAEFMQHGVLSSFTLGGFLGQMGGIDTPERLAHQQQQGRRFLEFFGIIPTRNTPANCPECGALLRTMTDNERLGWRYCCYNHNSRRRFGPLENTFLSRTRVRGEMTMDKIVMMMYMWFLRDPLIRCQEHLSMSSETAVYWYGFCRDVACAIAWHEYIPIGGAGDVVEVDESHLFKRKYHVGRDMAWQHIWVVGGISRATKKRFAIIVERRDAETLIPILQQCIDGESFICTDSWLAYGECDQIFTGHGRINHSENFIHPPRREPPLWMPPGRFNQECLDLNWNGPPPAPGQQPFRIHTQNVERMWEDLKKHLRTSNSVEFSGQYIGEYMYRKNILSGAYLKDYLYCIGYFKISKKNS